MARRINWQERFETAKKDYTKERANARKRAKRRLKLGIDIGEIPKSPLTGKKPKDYKEATKELERATRELSQYARENIPREQRRQPDEHDISWRNIYILLSDAQYAPDNAEFWNPPTRSRKASVRERAINASLKARDIILIELQNLIEEYGAKQAYKILTRRRSFDDLKELLSKAMYGYNAEQVNQGAGPLIAILRDMGYDAETAQEIANEIDEYE